MDNPLLVQQKASSNFQRSIRKTLEKKSTERKYLSNVQHLLELK